MFWVISVYFNIRNTLPKSGTFLLGHPVFLLCMIVWELRKSSADGCFFSCRGVLMLKYSIILNDPAMTQVNVVGLSLNVGYLICYYIYSAKKVNLAVSSAYTFFYWMYLPYEVSKINMIGVVMP